jgi:peptidoglycan/xylan/chitin deacetylase (PgdA/CDA1 family)
MPLPVPSSWPTGKPLAVCIDVTMEQWSDGVAPGSSPMVAPLKPGVLDRIAISWAEYGPRTGIYRLLDICEELGVKAGCFTSGLVCERFPEAVQRVVKGGHRIQCHGWSQDRFPCYLSREEEEGDLLRCIEAYTRIAGQRPTGYGAPRGTESPSTRELLVKNGFRWYAESMNADVPYVEQTPAGPLAIVPFSMDINDLANAIRYGNKPSAYFEAVRDIIEGYDSIHRPHWMMAVKMHSHVYGRPPGAIQFRKVLELLLSADFVWMTNRDALADLVLEKKAK